MQTITTKYHPATNRISCTAANGTRKYYPFPMWEADVKAHVECAKKFRDHMGWKGVMIGGFAQDTTGYVFCFKNSWIVFS